MDTGPKDKLHLVSIIPNKMVYNAQEKIALIFNSSLPSAKQGSYHVEFQGRKREVMRVRAHKINKSTLTVDVPVYFPAEDVKVHVRHVGHEGTTSLGSLPFQFVSRGHKMASLLQDCTDPVTFMCESLGISPSDMSALDKALTASFKTNMPPGFHLLGLRNNDVGHEISDSMYPTLLHFAAAFGLEHFIKDCLCHCSGFYEATMLQNCREERPSAIAYRGQFMKIFELLSSIETNGEDTLYEPMNRSSEDDEFYTTVARQGYINLQLWQKNAPGADDTDAHGYVHASRTKPDNEDIYLNMNENDPDGYTTSRTEAGPDEIYTDMESGADQYTTDPDGYIKTERPQSENEDLYADMESGAEEFPTDHDGYIRTERMQPECDDELYADMEGDHGGFYEDVARKGSMESGFEGQEELYMNEQELYRREGQATSHYQIPSNLPVSTMYPEQRSISISLKNRQELNLKSDQKHKSIGPPVASRKPGPKALVPPIKPMRPESIASGVSTVSADSGIGPEDSSEELFMNRQELLKSLTKPTEPPTLPPPDYGNEYQPAPPPRPISPRPKGNRNHERSKTLPVSQSDVQSAALLLPINQNRPASLKKDRPRLTNRPISDLPVNPRPPPPVPTDNRRGSDASQRPPMPAPTAAPSRHGTPTPFAQLTFQNEDLEPPPPAPPPRITSGQRTPAPTPAPRGQRKY